MLITQSELTERLFTIQKHNPRFPILTERFITTNDLLSNKRKETELKRLQTPNLEIKFEVKVKFQGFNPQHVFHVAIIEHKTTPVPFEVIHIDLERDPQRLDLTYGKIVFITHTLVLNIQRPFKLPICIYITNIVIHSFILPFTYPIPITIINTEKYLQSEDPNITTLLGSHYDCKKQHNLRQFNLSNVKQCTEAPSNIQHASVQARLYVGAKAKRIKDYKCVTYAKKERKICFQGSVRYRRVERTVWNHNTMPLPVTLDQIECKNIIRHLSGTNNKILNNPQYNKTFTLLEDHYFQERLEKFQTPFTVYQLNNMYTGTFTFMPADKNWIYDSNKNPYQNCPPYQQFEVNLVSGRLEISEIEPKYDDTENVMIIDGHTLSFYFADRFCKPTTKTLFTLVWLSDDFCLLFTLQDFLGRMKKK